MNNTFSFKRFGYLLREILVQRWIYFVGLFVIITIGQLLFGYKVTSPFAFIGTQLARLMFGALVAGIAITIIAMKQYAQSAAGIRNTLLPVSNLEKWGSIIFVNFVLLWTVYLLVFFTTDSFVYDFILAKARGENNKPAVSYLSNYNRIGEIRDAVYMTVGVISFLIAWILICSTYLRKNALPLSIVGFILFYFAVGTLNWSIAQLFFDQTIYYDQATPFSQVIVNDSLPDAETRRIFIVKHGTEESLIFPLIILSITMIISLIIYYFRLKETEI